MQDDTDKAQPATAGTAQGDAASAPQDDADNITTASPRATPPSVAPTTPDSKTDPARTTVFAARDDPGTADRWMSYAELAQARRTDKPSAVKLASRQRWRRRKNNQGVMQVLVPAKWAAPYWAAGAGPDMAPDVASISKADAAYDGGSAAARDASRAMDITHVLNTLDVAVVALRERAEAAERRADAADTDRRIAQVRLEHAEAATAAERERAAAALADERAKADALRAQIDVLNAEMVVMRAEADRALSEEQVRADRLSDQVEAGHRDLDAARAEANAVRGQLEAVERRAAAADTDRRVVQARLEHAEAAGEGERARADALRDRLTTMQEQLADAHAALQAAEVATTRAQQAEASRDTERQRADQAEQGREADRARADVLQAKLDDVQVQLTARQEVIDAAEVIRKADDARLARGRWARLRAAWRGR